MDSDTNFFWEGIANLGMCKIEYSKTAAKRLRRIPKNIAVRIVEKLTIIADLELSELVEQMVQLPVTERSQLLLSLANLSRDELLERLRN